MPNTKPTRRAFLIRTLCTAGGGLLASPLAKVGRAFGAPEAIPAKPECAVTEIRFSTVRGSPDKIEQTTYQECIYAAANAVGGYQQAPLDALAEMFSEEEPAVVLVDARSGAPSTRFLTMNLAWALNDLGLDAASITILDGSDADLDAGGYSRVREGNGPFCHGTEPAPGYGPEMKVPGADGTARFSKTFLEGAPRLAMVGRLQSGGTVMGPFVLDAALRAVDGATRKRASADPVFGARLLAMPVFAQRTGIIVGDLLDVPLASMPTGVRPVPAQDGESGTPWRAGELLAGSSLFAVEKVGHTILTNTCKARGFPAPRPHPILAAAERLGLPGAGMNTIAWSKLSR